MIDIFEYEPLELPADVLGYRFHNQKVLKAFIERLCRDKDGEFWVLNDQWKEIEGWELSLKP